MIHNKGIQYILILVFSLLLTKTSAQDKPTGLDVFLSPRVTIGYTFGGGMNYGIDLQVGIYQLSSMLIGTNFSYYMVNTPQGRHRIKGLTFSSETKYLNARIGVGRVSRKWGLKNVNNKGIYGFLIDVSSSFDEYKAPWLGVKSFIFNRAKWLYFSEPSYISVYGYWKSQNIEIYQDLSEVQEQ